MTLREVLTFRPYGDGLDHAITILKDVREASLEMSDQIEAKGGTVNEVMIGVPAAAIDIMVLQLEDAKSGIATCCIVRVTRSAASCSAWACSPSSTCCCNSCRR